VGGSSENGSRSVPIGYDETDMNPTYRMIRTLLVGLPRVQAPVGFEFRLQRRLEQVRSRRSGHAWDSWIFSWRWFSVGLGVATAVVVGLVFFTPEQGNLPSMATTQSIRGAGAPLVESSVGAVVNEEIAGPDRSYTGSPERESEQGSLADQGGLDSLGHEFHPPVGHFQSVGGNP
jgi:hypothetical protein